MLEYKVSRYSIILLLAVYGSLLNTFKSLAQIVVDSSTRTQSIIDGQSFRITGGQKINGFLLHQFQEFSVLQNSSVLFENPNSINTVISRVVGSKASQIRGDISVGGNANLVFVNPNGINFFRTSSLNINGSFLASTADKLSFLGNDFSLDISDNDSSIWVEGDGHNLIWSGNSRLPYAFNAPQSPGLAVAPKNSLSLISNKIEFDGGVLTAPSGNINLLALKKGKSIVSDSSNGFTLTSSITDLGSINLKNRAFINTSGTKNGSVLLQAKTINLTDASLVHSENFGNKDLGVIRIIASDIFLDGITVNTPLFPFTFDAYARGFSSVSNAAKGPSIEITADIALRVRVKTFYNRDP